MSSPNSKRVMPNWNVEPRTSNSPDKSEENPFSIKRRSFEPLSPEAQAKNSRNEEDMISNAPTASNSTNGIAANNGSPEPSDGVSSLSENNNVDVSSSDTPVVQIDAVVSSSDIGETSADSTVNQPDSTTYQQTGNASSSQPRVMCRFGETCYRINSTHREIFSHPGDSDYALRAPGANQNFLITPRPDAPDCRFGANCYRKNPKHFKNNKHPLVSATGRPQRTRNNRSNSPTSYYISSESDYDDDFSGDEDDEYVPPDSESSGLA